MAGNRLASGGFGTDPTTIIAHALPIVVGLVFIGIGVFVGAGIGVLPIGVPVGLAGLAYLLWGVFGGVER